MVQVTNMHAAVCVACGSMAMLIIGLYLDIFWSAGNWIGHIMFWAFIGLICGCSWVIWALQNTHTLFTYGARDDHP